MWAWKLARVNMKFYWTKGGNGSFWAYRVSSVEVWASLLSAKSGDLHEFFKGIIMPLRCFQMTRIRLFYR
ncbi:hypothetical protein ACOSQ3_017875 [Xanthoceras sorbifolium]